MSLPNHFLGYFVQTLNAEIGQDTLRMLLNKAGMDAELSDPQPLFHLETDSATRAYLDIQAALRLHYGRGTRGLLIRVGRLLWPLLSAKSDPLLKIRWRAIQLLPASIRVQPALKLLASLLRGKTQNQITIHNLDLDWMLVDHDFSGTLPGSSGQPVCFVTQGLIQECVYWAGKHELDVTEVTCKANGADACEFRIKAG
ncbi:MAG: 4-vinyl reductase [Anaerolineales bacterium]|nr:4-vinyl reductase [Anaerolineales bacterium]